MTPDLIIGYTILWILISILIPLNIWYYRDRRKMTPEERKENDEYTANEIRIW